MYSFWLLVAAQTVTAPVATPVDIHPAPSIPVDPQGLSDDVVVEGIRDLEDPKSAVRHKTLGSVRTGISPVTSKINFDNSQSFASCALGRRGKSLTWLRNMLDGTINSARQVFAQEHFARLNATCALDTQNALRNGKASGTMGDYDTYYDRGALFLEILQRTSHLALSRDETENRAVQLRFNARETPKARFRLKQDRFFFEVAVCMVRMQPGYALQLVRRGLSDDAVTRIEARLVNGSRKCVGNARDVYFDPSQFRFYIAEALYRWVVAARGVSTLIPATTD